MEFLPDEGKYLFLHSGGRRSIITKSGVVRQMLKNTGVMALRWFSGTNGGGRSSETAPLVSRKLFKHEEIIPV
jgi:hypothetical protein